MKLLFLSNVPAPYRVDFFNELGKYCDLTVTFEKAASDERHESWKSFSFVNFRGVMLKGISAAADRAFCPGVLKYVRDRSYDDVICTNLSSPTTILAILAMKLRKRSYYIEADGAFAGSGKGLRDRIKRFLVKGAKGCFSTCAECDRYFMKYGAEKEKIHRYPFTSMSADALRSADCATELSGKDWMLARRTASDEAKAKLGITEEVMVLSVGRYVGFKRMDVLVKSMKGVPRNTVLCIVGGEPPDEISRFARIIDANVRFVGFKVGAELKEYYRAADIFVLPSNGEIWGLVVNEAMAYGLPVVTTEKCNSGLTLIRPGINGKIVPPDDPDAMRNAIEELARDEGMRLAFGLESRRAVQDYTIENMCSEHLRILHKERGS